MSSDGPTVEAWPNGPTRLEDVYADLVLPVGVSGRPHVALGMVTSVDGAVAIDGRSQDLGEEGDGAAFRALRAACDVILVGAGTVRSEDYGPPSGDPERVERRRRAGLADRPLIAVVTGSGDLDPEARLFSDPTYRPLILTTEEAPTRALEPVADVVAVGQGTVDLQRAVAVAAERGGPRVLCEGGPGLNAGMLDAGLIDEVFVTVAPALVGGSSDRVLVGASEAIRALTLVSVIRVGDELLLRYTVSRADGDTDATLR